MLRFVLFLLFLVPAYCPASSENRWEFGVSVGEPMPLGIQAGYWWDRLGLRVTSGGWYQENMTFWVGSIGSFDYAAFQRHFYSVELGTGFHYFYAQAKDNLAITVNKTLGQRVLYDAQWVQWMAVAPQFTIRYFGLFTQMAVPIWQAGEVKYTAVWRVGFLF